ncbi:hypothetical protein D9M69_578600 [compost metagenome]
MGNEYRSAVTGSRTGLGFVLKYRRTPAVGEVEVGHGTAPDRCQVFGMYGIYFEPEDLSRKVSFLVGMNIDAFIFCFLAKRQRITY